LNLWHFEREFVNEGYKHVCGIDEAGRGPLAGPVYAAAVILPFGLELSGLDDSKKLSEKKRDLLFDEITEKAIDFGIGVADHKEIDALNILKATFLAMNRAVDSMKLKPDIALIDGNRDPAVMCRSKCIVGGDSKSASIAAASILAKVSRDRFMLSAAKEYPQYMFEKHKGYGTKLHYDKLGAYGSSEIHRQSFLKKWKAESQDGKTNHDTFAPKARGDLGEALALEFLNNKGYITLTCGFHSRFGEIDLIVSNSEYVVFVEVKLRKNAHFANARDSVDFDKRNKIKATADTWLQLNNSSLQPRFDVIELYAPDDSSPEIIHIEDAF